MSLMPLLVLCALLVLAVWHDVRARRIPNPLVYGGALAGLLLNAAWPGGAGVAMSLAGLALGLILLLPMYALRALGAGDVKLMAMTGAFAGPAMVTNIVLATWLAGGVLALAAAFHSHQLKAASGNALRMLRLGAPSAPSGRLPYAVAIAGGALPCLLYHALSGQRLLV